MSRPQRIVELTEYQERLLPESEMAQEEGQRLWSEYGAKVEVEAPSFKTNHEWRLKSLGWVGFIPVTPDFGIALRPKVPIANLFRMLEYAYHLRSFEFLEGLTDTSALEDVFDRLANVLAKRVLDRSRKGLHRAYLGQQEPLPFLRGSLDLNRHLQRPWSVRLPCQYEEHTPDIEDNQILAWTLQRLARSGFCTERTLPNVRRAFRALQGLATLAPFRPDDCVDRLYSRLNDDYQPLHALCRFFLEHAGPTHDAGDRRMLPFLVDMARLFELFVAEWLKAHLPGRYHLEYQDKVQIGDHGHLRFEIDMVLYDAPSGLPLAVMDTKYKATPQPSTEDIQQIVAYAESKGCATAVLIYPAPIEWQATVGEIRVSTLWFGLGDELEDAGKALLEPLLDRCRALDPPGPQDVPPDSMPQGLGN